MNTRLLIYLSWIFIIFIGPITLFLNIDFTDTFSDPVLVINFFQRISGLILFSMLFCQILLGSYLKFWTKFLGSKPIRIHIIQGLSIFALLLAHPILYVVFTFQTLQILTLFLLPNLNINSPVYELYLSYGRIAFVLLFMGIFVGYFRTHPRLRHIWQRIHIINYFSFYFVAIHAYNIGSDILTPPFSIFFWIANGIISFVVLKRFSYKLDFIFAPKTNPQKS